MDITVDHQGMYFNDVLVVISGYPEKSLADVLAKRAILVEGAELRVYPYQRKPLSMGTPTEPVASIIFRAEKLEINQANGNMSFFADFKGLWAVLPDGDICPFDQQDKLKVVFHCPASTAQPATLKLTLRQ